MTKSEEALQYFNAIWAGIEKHMDVDPECAHWPETIREAIEEGGTALAALAAQAEAKEDMSAPKVLTEAQFDEWLCDRMNECARAGIENGDMPAQLTADQKESFPHGVKITE